MSGEGKAQGQGHADKHIHTHTQDHIHVHHNERAHYCKLNKTMNMDSEERTQTAETAEQHQCTDKCSTEPQGLLPVFMLHQVKSFIRECVCSSRSSWCPCGWMHFSDDIFKVSV